MSIEIPEEYKTDSLKELTTSINNLRASTDSTNSYARTFLHGIIYGIAFAIGTSIIAVFLIGALFKTVSTVAELPVVGDMIRASGLITILDKSMK